MNVLHISCYYFFQALSFHKEMLLLANYFKCLRAAHPALAFPSDLFRPTPGFPQAVSWVLGLRNSSTFLSLPS